MKEPLWKGVPLSKITNKELQKANKYFASKMEFILPPLEIRDEILKRGLIVTLDDVVIYKPGEPLLNNHQMTKYTDKQFKEALQSPKYTRSLVKRWKRSYYLRPRTESILSFMKRLSGV